MRSKVEIFLKIVFLGASTNKGRIDHLIRLDDPNSEVLEEYPSQGRCITRPNKLTAYSARKQKQTPNSTSSFTADCSLARAGGREQEDYERRAKGEIQQGLPGQHDFITLYTQLGKHTHTRTVNLQLICNEPARLRGQAHHSLTHTHTHLIEGLHTDITGTHSVRTMV